MATLSCCGINSGQWPTACKKGKTGNGQAVRFRERERPVLRRQPDRDHFAFNVVFSDRFIAAGPFSLIQRAIAPLNHGLRELGQRLSPAPALIHLHPMDRPALTSVSQLLDFPADVLPRLA